MKMLHQLDKPIILSYQHLAPNSDASICKTTILPLMQNGLSSVFTVKKEMETNDKHPKLGQIEGQKKDLGQILEIESNGCEWNEVGRGGGKGKAPLQKWSNV